MTLLLDTTTADRVEVSFTPTEWARVNEALGALARENKRLTARRTRRQRPIEAEDAMRFTKAMLWPDVKSIKDDSFAGAEMLIARGRAHGRLLELAVGAARFEGKTWKDLAALFGEPWQTIQSRFKHVPVRPLGDVAQEVKELQALLEADQ